MGIARPTKRMHSRAPLLHAGREPVLGPDKDGLRTKEFRVGLKPCLGGPPSITPALFYGARVLCV